MSLDWDAAEVVVDIVQFALTGLIAVLAFTWRRNRAAIDDLRSADESHALQLDDQDTRITIMEQRLNGLPTHGDLGEVARRLDTLHGDVRELTATVTAVKDRLAAIDSAVDRIEDYLLKKARA